VIIPPETFELEHLRLRRPRLSDAEAIFDYGSDPEVARFTLWPLRTNMDSLMESLQERQVRWDEGMEFNWVITLRTRDQAIGGASCCVDRHAAEIGYLVSRNHWGHGYATRRREPSSNGC